MILTAAVTGLALGAGLIIAIGAQNAFVLRQGLIRQHVFTVCLICALCDGILIAIGVMGFGSLVASNEGLKSIAIWGGVAFLISYGLFAFRRAMRPQSISSSQATVSKAGIVATTLAVSLLNPHVYLDTVVFVGSLAGQYEGSARMSFGAGAILASFLWFFGLGYGARLLAPLFERLAAWRILDIAIGLIMWAIAWNLVGFI